jgi:hypothetical protein
MRSPKLRALLVLASLAAYAPSSVAAASGGAPASSHKPIYFYENLGVLQSLRVRPRRITFNADGNNAVTGLRWTRWGTRNARATGTNHVNNCIPNCVQGRISRVYVHITLSQPGTFKGHRVYRCFAVKPTANAVLRHSCL